MGPIILFLILMAGFCTLVFFKWPPEYYKEKKVISVYNWSVMGLSAMVCGAWIFKTYALYNTDPRWKLIASGGALGLLCVILLVAFLARNFWIFRAPRQGGFF